MLGTIAFLVTRRLLRLVGLGARPDANDVEIAVLREGCQIRDGAVTCGDVGWHDRGP